MARIRRAVVLHAAVWFMCLTYTTCDAITSQRDAVVALYDAVDATSTLKTRYSDETTLCMLYGVQCDTNGAVESLSLTGQQYQGSLPSDLALWSALATSLKMLELSNIGLTGPIPQTMSVLGDSLVELRLNKNYLTGSVPAWSFLHLKTLDLSDNSLSGMSPLFSSGEFPALQTLNLRDNPRLCVKRGTGADVDTATFSASAFDPNCLNRLGAPQACDCLWASANSYACSAATANCAGSTTDKACAVLDGPVGKLKAVCNARRYPPPPRPPRSPPPSPPPRSPRRSSDEYITESSVTSGGSTTPVATPVSNAVSNAANSSVVLDVCNYCLGSFNNTNCQQAVCAYDATACSWLNAITIQNSANFTDSAEAFARWLKGEEMCASKLQYPADFCECTKNWGSADCRAAQLEACISRKDLCAQIISAPTSLVYSPIVNYYTNSCSINQTAVISGVSVSLYLISRTLTDWNSYRTEVKQSMADVGRVPVGNVTEITAVELPGPTAEKPVVLAVIHLASSTPDATFNTVYQAFQSQSMQPPEFTQALQTLGVPLTSSDLFAAMSLTYPPSPPKAPDTKKKSTDVQWWLIVLICLAAIVLLGIIAAVWFLYQRSRKKKEDIWDMKFPPPPSVHNSQYSPKPSRSVRLEPTGYGSRPSSLPPSAAPSPTMRTSNPYLDPERPFDPHSVPGPPIYAGSPYARTRNPHTPHAPPSPSMPPMNRDEAQAERAKFWAQFQLSWERQKARQAAGATHPRVGATFEDDDDIPSSGTSWTSQSDAKHAFRRY